MVFVKHLSDGLMKSKITIKYIFMENLLGVG